MRIPVCAGFLGIFAAVALAASDPASAQEFPAEACWPEAVVPAGSELTLTPRSQEASLAFRSRARIEVTTLAGEAVADDANFTGRIALAAPAGEIRVGQGEILATTLAGGRFLITAGDRDVLLTPVLGTSVDFSAQAARITGGQLEPAIGNVPISSDAPVEVTLSQPTTLAPWMHPFVAEEGAVRPSRNGTIAAGHKPNVVPINSLQVHMHDPRRQLASRKDQIVACVEFGGTIHPAPVLEIRDVASGGTELTLMLPEAAGLTWADSGRVAVLAADGTFLAADRFRVFGTWAGLAITGLVLCVVGWILAWITRSPRPVETAGWLSWISGAGGKPSLSLFQILLWTVTVFGSLVYVFTLTGELFAITGQVLILLGIAGTGSIAARLVGASQGPPPTSAVPKFADILQTDGAFDLYKVQMFTFTLGAAIYVAIRVVREHAFPELDENLLLLLGISNGIYVGAKFAEDESPLQRAVRLERELELLTEAGIVSAKETAHHKADVELIEEQLATKKGALDAARQAVPQVAATIEAIERDVAETEARLDRARARAAAEEVKLAQIEEKIVSLTKEKTAAVAQAATA